MGVEMKRPLSASRRVIIICAVAALACIFSGCKKNHKVEDTNSVELSLNQVEEPAVQMTPQKWHVTNKRVAVLFGYDFNNPEIKEKLLAQLSENFGLDEDGGLIYPLSYPDDFKHGIKGYASDFTAILLADNLDLCGVVLLGAPENTHIALARNQDKWEQ